MSIWRNCRTAVIFKSIVSPHATCELKRMCFPEDIQCLMLSCRFLGRSWNFLSAASWLIHQQQFRGTEDAACWRSGYGNCQCGHAVPFGLWGSSQADCPAHNPRKRDSYTLKGPSRFISGTSFFSSCWLQGPRAWLQGLSPWVCSACDRFSKSGKEGKGVCKSSAEVSIPVSGGEFFCLYVVVPVQKSSDTKYMDCWCRAALCKEDTVKRMWRLL